MKAMPPAFIKKMAFLSRPPPDRPAASPDSHGSERPSRFQYLTLLHVATLLVFASWDFGGETDFARMVIRWWGSLAPVILGNMCLRRWKRHEGPPSAVRWLWPLVLFNLLVAVSALNPSFTASIVQGLPCSSTAAQSPAGPAPPSRSSRYAPFGSSTRFFSLASTSRWW